MLFAGYGQRCCCGTERCHPSKYERLRLPLAAAVLRRRPIRGCTAAQLLDEPTVHGRAMRPHPREPVRGGHDGATLQEPARGTNFPRRHQRIRRAVQRHLRQAAERERVPTADSQRRYYSTTVLDGRRSESYILKCLSFFIYFSFSLNSQVSVTTLLYGTIPIFGKRTIILDKSPCSLPPAPANPTCQALQNLRSRLPLCSLNQACNGLNCAVLGAPYTVAFEVEPCNEPPSILLTVRNPSGAVVYNSSVNNSTVISLGANVRLSVVLRQLDDAIALKVSLFYFYFLISFFNINYIDHTMFSSEGVATLNVMYC